MHATMRLKVLIAVVLALDFGVYRPFARAILRDWLGITQEVEHAHVSGQGWLAHYVLP